MKRSKGFTLIELMAVIVILGVLLSLTSVSVNKIRKKQDLENHLNVVSSIMSGAKGYIADHPEFWDSTETADNETGSTNPYSRRLGNGRWIKLSDILPYADFDIQKYPDLYYSDKTGENPKPRSAFAKYCESNPNKYSIILYLYKGDNETYYLGDCGCEEQMESKNSLKFCDLENPGFGWNIDGQYYKNDDTRSDNTKDIKVN